MFKDRKVLHLKDVYRSGVLMFVVFLLAGCGKGALTDKSASSESKVMLFENANEEVTQEFKMEKVIRGTFVETGYQNGTLEYLDSVAAEVDADNAVFVKYKAKVGDLVKKGDVIAEYYVDYDRVNLVEMKNNVKNLEDNYKATLNSKKAEIAELENKIKIMPKGSEKEITKAKLGKLKLDFEQFKKTEESVKTAKKQYREFMEEIDKTKVKAPKSGYIVSLTSFEEGDSLTLGTRVAEISNKKEFLITIPNDPGINFTDEPVYLRYNMEVEVQLGENMNAIKTTMKGRVISAPNVLTSQGMEQDVLYIEPIDPPQDADWDSNVYVQFERLRIEDALMVPVNAVSIEQDAYIEERNKYYVMVMEDGVQRKRYIVSDRSNTEYYRVLQGLNEGQEVVVKK